VYRNLKSSKLFLRGGAVPNFHQRTLIPDELSIYQNLTREAAEGHSAELLAAYGMLNVLGNEKPEAVVIVAFPSMKHAKELYFSPLTNKRTASDERLRDER